MRILLVGVAAVALSGCSWLGLGGQHHNSHYNNHTGYYHAQKPVQAKTCNSGQCLARWNVEGAIGPEFITGGKALTGDRAHNIGGNASFNNVDMNDAYETGYRAELGGSYAINPNRKVTANGFYSKAEGENNVALGTVNGNAVTGSFSDYNSYGAEIGLRQYMHPRRGLLLNSVRPYVEGKVGGAYVEDINLENVTGGGATLNGTVPLYESGWVPTAAGMVGFETPAFKQMTLGLETGLRYTGKMSSDTTTLGGNNIAAGTNNGSDRWTVPVMLRGRYRF